jgi:hypothetical protein
MVGIFDECGRKTIVRVVYSDESGTGSIEEEPILVVAAILMNMDMQWRPIEQALDRLAPKRNFEFHGARLFRALKNGRKRDRADELLRGVLSVPATYRVPIIYCAIDRDGYRRNVRKTPHSATEYQMAFFICVDKIDTLVRSMFAQESVLWIADHSGHHEQQIKLSHWLAKRMPEVIETKPFSDVFPERRAHISPIADRVYFGDSKESRALQLVDVCCSAIVLHHQGVSWAAPYYDLIKGQVIYGEERALFGTPE